MKKFSCTFLLKDLSPFLEITGETVQQLRRDIPGWAGRVREIHTGRKEFDRKDTVHGMGVANPGR